MCCCLTYWRARSCGKKLLTWTNFLPKTTREIHLSRPVKPPLLTEKIQDKRKRSRSSPSPWSCSLAPSFSSTSANSYDLVNRPRAHWTIAAEVVGKGASMPKKRVVPLLREVRCVEEGTAFGVTNTAFVYPAQRRDCWHREKWPARPHKADAGWRKVRHNLLSTFGACKPTAVFPGMNGSLLPKVLGYAL